MSFAALAIILWGAPLWAQDPAADHEGYPVLKASEFLKPEVLKGPYHTVMDAVPTQGFANQYTVETQWGIFTVRGTHLLAKREIASYLQVDPYSENQILQKKLDDVARASFAGGFVVRAGTFALGSKADVGVAKAAGAVSITSDVAKTVYSNDPTSLSLLNRQILEKLGVSGRGASAFLEHPNITPSQQTELTGNLARLGPVPGIEDYLKMVGTSRDAAEVAYFVNSLSMMADYHERISPGKRVLDLYGLPAMHCQEQARDPAGGGLRLVVARGRPALRCAVSLPAAGHDLGAAPLHLGPGQRPGPQGDRGPRVRRDGRDTRAALQVG